MKFGVISLIYPQELTPEQENILKVNIEEVRIKIAEALDKTPKKLHLNELQLLRFQTLSRVVMDRTKLVKVAPNIWQLWMPRENLTGIELQVLNYKFPTNRLLPEKVFRKFLLGPVAEDQGLKGKILYELEEKSIESPMEG